MTNQAQNPVRAAVEIAVSLALLALLLVYCFRIIQPFISLIVWGAVIAVALYTPFLKLERALGGSRKRAVLVFVVLGLGVVLAPAILFAGDVMDSVKSLRASLESGRFHVPPPREGVREWPFVGARIYEAWREASVNLGEFLTEHSEQVKLVAGKLLTKLAGISLSVLQFVIATLIAAAMLANADGGKRATGRIFGRLVGTGEGERMRVLVVATIRSVAVGVLGIAVIQAIGAGIGMVAVGVPAAGVLALIVLVLAIAQLPPWLVLLPVIVYVFSIHSTPVAVVFALWSLLVSFADMFLKPLLLGRGVEAPMPVILVGAIGGMLLNGIIGLFVGAVVLAVGYKLFQAWLAGGVEARAAATGPAEPG